MSTVEILGGANDGQVFTVEELSDIVKIPVYSFRRDCIEAEILGFDLCERVCMSEKTGRMIYKHVRRLPPE